MKSEVVPRFLVKNMTSNNLKVMTETCLWLNLGMYPNSLHSISRQLVYARTLEQQSALKIEDHFNACLRDVCVAVFRIFGVYDARNRIIGSRTQPRDEGRGGLYADKSWHGTNEVCNEWKKLSVRSWDLRRFYIPNTAHL
jgi:hypothetical protein